MNESQKTETSAKDCNCSYSIHNSTLPSQDDEKRSSSKTKYKEERRMMVASDYIYAANMGGKTTLH